MRSARLFLGVAAGLWAMATACSETASGPDRTAGDGAADGSAPADAATEAAAWSPITLAASSTMVMAAGDIVLRATITGPAPSAVEFLEGARSIGTDGTEPFEHVVSFTAIDNGAHPFAAKAIYPTGGATSVPIVVTVNVPDDSLYVDPTKGVDGNAGTRAAPVKTLAKAAQVVKPGQTIVLADGVYDLANQTTLDVAFPAPARVRGSSPTGVVLRGNGTTTGLAFAKGGEVRDVGFEDFSSAVNVTGGTFAASGVSFANVGLPFYFRGDSKGTVDVTGVATALSKVPASGLGFALLVVEDTAEVAWKGGLLAGVTSAISGALVRGAGRLNVEGLTIKELHGHAFVLFDNGHLTLKDVVIQRAGLGSAAPDKAIIAMGGQNTQPPLSEALELDGTEIASGTGPAIVLSLYGGIPSKPTIKLKRSHIDDNAGPGLWVVSPGNLSPELSVFIACDGTTFRRNQGGGIIAARAALTITGGDISSNGAEGIQLNDSSSTNTLVVRGTTFAANVGDAISFTGAAGSTLDLGQAGSEGKQVFAAIPPGGSAVHLQAPIQGLAVGNLWLPSQQGTGPDGKYAAATTLRGPVAGVNVTLDPGATLVVAP
jgi:hypothetical protein